MHCAVIARTARMVILVTAAPFDQTTKYTLSRVRWARRTYQGSVLSPISPIGRGSKTSLPHSAAAVGRVCLVSYEAAIGEGFEVQRPPFLHEPFIKSDIR